MRKIAVITGSRADECPLRYVIEMLGDDCVHIKTNHVFLNEAKLMKRITEVNPAIIVILGDRYETLTVAKVATWLRIPIAHISGGEETVGAIDNGIRHAITKLSYWHFTACAAYSMRVEQMGEDPENIFNVGDPQIDSIAMVSQMTDEALEQNFGPLCNPVMLMTYHPETLSDKTPLQQVKEVLRAIPPFGSLIICGANQDEGGDVINKELMEFSIDRSNTNFYPTLSHEAYTNIMRRCDIVIGNSSSGVIEAPAMGKMSVTIGDRQKGRITPDTVIHVICEEDFIRRALQMALQPPMIASAELPKDFILRPGRVHYVENMPEMVVRRIAPSYAFGVPGEVSRAIVDRLMAVAIPKLPRKVFHELG